VSAGVHSIPRKGTSILLEAFSRAALSGTDRLLLAGPLGDNLRRRLQTDFAELWRANRIVLIDRYLDSNELMHALAAADVVCTPYVDHFGSSAIALQSAQVQRPVLAPRQGWFGDMIPRFGLGTTVPTLDPGVLADGLPSALESSARFSVGDAARRLLAYSDAANFGRLWAAQLRARLMLPSDPDLRTWQWVTESGEGTRH
jgi:glycosyltransferase involved in cell wall biosynthesis